tara:strand:+ start:123 stop:272 length:150 start_codon:yes stop_codon:yes gene_type:complete
MNMVQLSIKEEDKNLLHEILGTSRENIVIFTFKFISLQVVKAANPFSRT